MRVLLTRPQEDAGNFAEHLSRRGHQAISAPLLSVRFHDSEPLKLDGVQGILVTSANGIRALARLSERRDLPVFAVGPQTAREALAAGFARVEGANGDAAALAQALPRWAKAEAGALLHAVGAQGAGRLASLLAAKGYEVRTVILYDVVAAATLPEPAARALKEGSLDAALFFSPRSARVFRDCTLKAGLAAACPRLLAVCISQAAASALSPLSFAEIRVAAAPSQAGMLGCLD